MVNDQSVAQLVVAFIAVSETVASQKAAQSHIVLAVEVHLDYTRFLANIGINWRRFVLTEEQDSNVLA